MDTNWSTLMPDFDERIEILNKLIKTHTNIMFFGGAGVSTASGIPDFRSKNGLYNQHDVKFDMYEPEYLLSKKCLFNNPKVFYEFYRQKMDCRNIEPNSAHYKLAEMESKGKLSAVITQNIDGLHQKAGSKNVFEVHGTTTKVYCAKCGKEYPSDYIFTTTDVIPKCDCGGHIRPDVTLYGETLPKSFFEALQAVEKADMLIVAGTSLLVSPANTIVDAFQGNDLVIVNNDVTNYDKYANVLFHENITDVFNRINLEDM